MLAIGDGTTMIKSLLSPIYCGVFVLFILAASLTSSLADDLSDRTVGFRHMSLDGVEIGVWYASTSKAEKSRLGPFDVHYAKDGEPATGLYPIVLMSHGVMGRYRNHHLTASALVRKGYLVVAPTHAHDSLIFESKIVEGMTHRLHDVTTALGALDVVPDISAIADRTRIYGLGYSLGSATILVAAGGAVNLDLLAEHCADHGAEDAYFCAATGVPWYERLFNWAFSRDQRPRQLSMPSRPINGDIALVAPMGQGLDLDAIKEHGKFGVFALGEDQRLPVVFHAQALRDALPAHRVRFHEYEGVHHFAFIAPFPKWLTDSENIPVAKDPEGFDRQAFIDNVNQDIVGFFGS
jgi:predicted dienelactone hydrolase